MGIARVFRPIRTTLVGFAARIPEQRAQRGEVLRREFLVACKISRAADGYPAHVYAHSNSDWHTLRGIAAASGDEMPGVVGNMRAYESPDWCVVIHAPWGES